LVTLNNTAAESLLGFRLPNTRNRPLEDVIVSAQPIAQPILAAFHNGMRWGGVEADLVRRDGTTLAAYIRAVALPNGDGGLILIADRTDQRQFQAQSDHLERRACWGIFRPSLPTTCAIPSTVLPPASVISLANMSRKTRSPISVGKMQAEVNRIEPTAQERALGREVE